jgi:hypothetical protein
MVARLPRIRSPRTFSGRLALFAVGIIALFGGLLLLETVIPGDAGDLGEIEGPSLAVIAMLGFAVVAGEAIVFTILPTELSARFLRHGLWGLIAGAVAYSPVFHASNGTAGVIVSAWIALVIGAVYYLQRASSVLVACAQAVGLKWAFWIAALSTIASGRAV